MFFRKQAKGKVFVGLSGGVDSSVAAKRLIEQGYDVTGVFIKTWQPDFLVCNWEAERLDAMRVAAHLGIPFRTCDAVDVYRYSVAQYMIEEYKKGRTPNPDVMCNKFVKFGEFLDYAREHGAAAVATGHYARVEKRNGSYVLMRGIDQNKDQSYFLWTLTQEQLSSIHFPVGDTNKEVIRKEAGRAGLSTFQKSDSQGICFLGEVDIKEFLSHYVQTERGKVLNETGEVVGEHDGALFYTLGQRHGFTIFTKGTETAPRYVTAKDVEANTITVAEHPETVSGKTVTLTDCNLADDLPETCEAQFRYRQKPFSVKVVRHNDGVATVEVLADDIEMPTPGQSCVLYMGDVCLGGGIIDTVK